MHKPNFLILGAARCGTNTIYHFLSRHPDVLMSTPKEPFFFEAEYERGLEYYWKTYLDWRGQRAVGEARPANLFLPYVPLRVRDSIPEARLVAILRNPAQRAFSHWWMKRSRGLEDLSFEAAIDDNLARLESAALSTVESTVQALVRPLELDRLVPRRIRAPLRKMLSRFGSFPRMSGEIRSWLIEHYQSHNRELERLISRDLSDWDSTDSATEYEPDLRRE
jgi:hypothetical protein